MKRDWVIGLTGGLASGKSTVGRLLSSAGYPVIDTDAVGHDILADSAHPAFRTLVDRFGADILDGQTIHRARMAQRVFDNPELRKDLEEILHPAIAAEAFHRIEDAHRTGHPVAILEVPLLVEVGWDRQVDRVVVVDCPPEVQIQRFIQRTGETEEQATQRLKAQISREERLLKAHHVIANEGTLEQLEQAVHNTIQWLQQLHKPARQE